MAYTNLENFIDQIQRNPVISRELEEINLILASLQYFGETPIIKDIILKKRIVIICLEIIKNTPHSKREMLNTAYDLSIFYEFNYEDELNNIFKELFSLISTNSKPLIFYKWRKIQKKLSNYLLN